MFVLTKCPALYRICIYTAVTLFCITVVNLPLHAQALMNARPLKLFSSGSPINSITIQGPTTYGSAYTLTMPASAPALNQLLVSDGSGNLSWGLIGSSNISSGGVALSNISTAGATSGDVLTYNGSSVVWGSGGSTVVTNATLQGDGSGGNQLRVNLGNSNTWTANQTFASTFLITANARIAMTNSDNNARDIRFQEPSGTGSQYIGWRAPSVSNNGNYVFPAVVGSVGQVLTIATSNGIDSATTQWTTAGGSPTGAAGGDLSGTYPNPNIANDAVTSSNILDGTIVNADISASAAISYSKLSLTNSIQNADIVANAITTSKVANGTVTTSKMADSAISGLKLLTFAVQTNHIAAGAVTPAKISSSGASTGNVLTYNGSSVVWAAPSGSTGIIFNRNGMIANAGNTSYTQVTADEIIGIDMSAGTNFTVNLLPATTAGKTLIIKIEKYNNALLPVLTILPNGTDKIDGANSLAFGNAGGNRRLYCDGTGNWYAW